MINFEKLLSQRDRFIHWAPIVALILIVTIEFAPFYQVEDNVTDKDLTDEQMTIEYDFYDEYRIVKKRGFGNIDNKNSVEDRIVYLYDFIVCILYGKVFS